MPTPAAAVLRLPFCFQQIFERLKVVVYLASARSLEERTGQPEEGTRLGLHYLRQVRPLKRWLEGIGELLRHRSACAPKRKLSVGQVAAHFAGRLEPAT